jgi:hypothetical protein
MNGGRLSLRFFVHLLLQLPGRIGGIVWVIIEDSLAFLGKEDVVGDGDVIGRSFEDLLLGQLELVCRLFFLLGNAVLLFSAYDEAGVGFKLGFGSEVILIAFFRKWFYSLCLSKGFLKFEHAGCRGERHAFDLGEKVFSFIII